MTTQQAQLQAPFKIPKKRVTMNKHVVGKVRKASHCLPEGPFVFGIANKMDEEGAGIVLQSWAQSEPSKPQISMRSFPATNRKALQNGCLSAKMQREFAKNNLVMKTNLKSNTVKKHQNNECPNHVFGIKSLANDVPIKQLLQSIGVNFEETDYPDRSNMQKKGRLPPAKSTKASRLLEASIKPQPIEQERKAIDEFKMSKFLKVESKVKAMIQ